MNLHCTIIDFFVNNQQHKNDIDYLSILIWLIVSHSYTKMLKKKLLNNYSVLFLIIMKGEGLKIN